MSKPRQKISLILGSGGARGLAHIGAIHFLEEHNFEIASIAGSSMGALVGGAYATGKLTALEEWLLSINKAAMFSLIDVAWNKAGLVKGEKIINTLREILGEQDIENLPIPFTVVASDIQAGKEVWLSSGCLFNAIRASISMPLFFTPYIHHGVALIDGGVLNPVPIAPTFRDKTDLSIAINLGGPVDESLNQPNHTDLDQQDKSNDIFSKLMRGLGSKTEDAVPSLGAYDIANQAIDAMQETIARQKLAAYPPDYLIEIPRNICGILDFHRAEEMIDFGYQQASTALQELI